MKVAMCFAILGALATSGSALAVGRISEVAIIDRDTGLALTPHFYRGEYWVAGTAGARFSVEIRNRLGDRVLAVTSVDGVNVISGSTAGWDQTGYVFNPGERYQITGWRKSDTEVAAFTFTDSPHSYAGLTGRPANIGVIGVALFRERPQQPVYESSLGRQSPAAPEDRREAEAGARPDEPMEKAPSARASDSAATVQSPIAAAAPKLGTGHGAREYAYVSHTDFQRMQPEPNEIICIHYDSMDNLIAMGIVRRPRPSPSSANPFPATPGPQYVPDPPG